MLIGPSWTAMICVYFWVGCFGITPEPFMVVSGPKDLVHFELRDSEGETVWALHAEEPQTLGFIAYGLVPAGFTQQFPAAGIAPRELLPGEIVTTEIRSLKRVFIHRGLADYGGRFAISDWSMHLIDAPVP